MKKTIYWIVGIVIVVVVVIFVAQSKPSETGPIKIGYVGPLTGDAAGFGETEKNATQFAVDEINSSGGINGRQVQIIYEDGKCTGKDATTATQKLIGVDKVKIILGGMCSSETLAIIPLIDQNKVLLFSALSSNPQLSGASKYFFRIAPSDSDVAKIDADLIVKLYKKVAMVSEKSDYSLGVRDVMEKIFTQNGVTVVADEQYDSNLNDFKTIFTKIKNSGADVIYLNPSSSTKAGAVMVKQARQLGIITPIHGNFSLASADALQIGGSYMNDVVSTDNIGMTDSGKKLLAEYTAKYGAPPLEYLMGADYDRIKIIAEALKSVGMNSDKIRAYILGIKEYNGTVGNYHFDQNGDIVGKFTFSIVIKDGKKVPYNP